jgi:hypothetical protein
MRFETRPYAELRLQGDDFTNPRSRTGLDADSLRELAIHIGLHGLKNPLTVTSEGVITAGQRRYLAISMILTWEDTLANLVGDEEAIFNIRRRQFQQGVPCVLDEHPIPAERMGLSIADNLLHAEMSSYDVAEQVIKMVEGGSSQQSVADLIGKSRPYVSKLVGAWRGSCDELRSAWADGTVSYARVQELADLPHDQQVAALEAPPPEYEGRRSGSRGTHGRPPVSDLKHALESNVRRLAVMKDPTSDAYLRGIVVGLRVATGDLPISEILER